MSMKIDLVKMLEEIYAHYKSKGVAVPQTEIGEALGVNQSTISKWLNRSNKPNRYAAPIMALHHELTGQTVSLPMVTGETDDHIRRIIELMQEMDERDRAVLVGVAEGMLLRNRVA